VAAGRVAACLLAVTDLVRLSLLTNRAAKFRISLRTNRTVFTPAVEAEILRLVGKVRGRTIAQQLGLRYRSLLDWGKRRDVRFTFRQSETFIATYARLKSLAQKAGFRFSWCSPETGISLWVAVAEGLSPRQAEVFLSRANRERYLDAAETAYDRGVATLQLNASTSASLGAAAYRRRPPGPVEHMRVREITRFDNQPPTIRQTVHLVGIIAQPRLGGCISRPQLMGASGPPQLIECVGELPRCDARMQ
jgi:hypothetical protein